MYSKHYFDIALTHLFNFIINPHKQTEVVESITTRSIH